MSEQQVIEQLQEYRRIAARIKVLERQPVGMGYTVNALAGDDQLQELHKQLRGQPSHKYLNYKERQLEATAHAHLERYPAGIRSQYREVSGLRDDDPAETKLLKELTKRVRAVFEARTGTIEGFEEILERMAELQELQLQKDYIDNALEVLDQLFTGYGKLIRLRYIDGLSTSEVMDKLNIAERTYSRWKKDAVTEYGRLVAHTWH